MEIKPLINKDYEKIQENETISRLLSKLKKRNIMVFKGKDYAGIVKKIDLLKSKVPITKMKIAVKKVPVLSYDAGIEEAAYMMYTKST